MMTPQIVTNDNRQPRDYHDQTIVHLTKPGRQAFGTQMRVVQKFREPVLGRRAGGSEDSAGD